MNYRPLGKSGIEASTVALGAWAIGGWMWGGQDEQQSIRAIQAAIDEGINLIDTAPMYGFGRSEQIIGRAIAGRREKVVIATKCGLRWDIDQGEVHFRTTEEAIDPHGEIVVRRCCKAESIIEEVEQSLRRLSTDHIDLLQTHWQDPATPIEETAQAMARLKEQGKIRAIGASNASPQQMDIYRRVSGLDTDQEKYSMLFRDAEKTLLPYCLQHNVAFLAYSPLANGLLSGRMGPERTFPPGDLRGTRPLFSQENRRTIAALLEEIRPIAEAHAITISQLVIAWTLHQPGCTHALVGIRDPQQARENAAAADVRLTSHELLQINAGVEKVQLRL